MEDIRVATVQFEHKDGDKQANLATITRFVEQAAAQGVQIITFPEACITGYWYLRKLSRPELEALAEPVFDGPSSRALMDLSQRHNMTIGAGLVEITNEGELFNTYVVAMPDGRFAMHRKIHCFISEHLGSGSEYTVFDTPHGCRVGVLICYDNNLIENVRITALMGAEVLLAPHQTGGCKTASPHCMGWVDKAAWENRHTDPDAIRAELSGDKGRGWLMRWLPSRAHDNGIFLLFANGIGYDDDEIRTGNAMVLDPYGRIIDETCAAGDDMVVADLDASLRGMSTGERWLNTRRPELYAPLTVPTGREQATRTSRFETLED
jgi:N-carbamoylputrescine amidase